MNTTLNRLIRLNVELEGALRVAAGRPSPEALEAAREKFDEMTALFATLAPASATNQHDEEQTQLKYDEALNGEDSPMDEPTDGMVPADGQIVETDAEAEAVPAATSSPAPEAQRETPAQESRPIAVDERMLKSDLRKSFTLNDKFRFRRELFGGDDAEFSDTLDLLATMHSLSEAEEYIYDDLQWSREDENVAEFMDIVANFFNTRK
ncbi:MAG: hypothetical protein JFR41_10210 [Muribaculaceae bacterium]|nr:hypothetical protein [Muribaculaceae bacterium]